MQLPSCHDHHVPAAAYPTALVTDIALWKVPASAAVLVLVLAVAVAVVAVAAEIVWNFVAVAGVHPQTFQLGW